MKKFQCHQIYYELVREVSHNLPDEVKSDMEKKMQEIAATVRFENHTARLVWEDAFKIGYTANWIEVK